MFSGKTRNIRVSTFRHGQSGLADQIPGENEDNKCVVPRLINYVPAYGMFRFLNQFSISICTLIGYCFPPDDL